MRYNQDFREAMLEIKHGKYTRHEVSDLLAVELSLYQAREQDFMKMSPNEHTREKVDKIVYDMVYEHMVGGK